MVGLDRCTGAFVGDALDHVGVQGTLKQVLHVTLDGLCMLLERLNEQPAYCLSLQVKWK